jgi:hypothetical protein
MKVAQQFSPGLMDKRCPARDDGNVRNSFRSSFSWGNAIRSSLGGRPGSKKANPATNCWGTCIAALRDYCGPYGSENQNWF